nr:transposase [Anaerovirgula multivorans]
MYVVVLLKSPFDEHFSFFRRYQRYTIAYEEYVFKLGHKNTIKNASDVGEGTCQRIYNHYAKKAINSYTPEPLRLLGIDDIASKKGHNYDTIIYNQGTGGVVAILFGRKKEDVKAGIEAISMDMRKSYCLAVLECLPNAMPVIDRFHISRILIIV